MPGKGVHERLRQLEDLLDRRQKLSDRYLKRAVAAEEQLQQLAKDIVSLADDAGMPESYRQTDQRMLRAKKVLADHETFRYDHENERQGD